MNDEVSIFKGVNPAPTGTTDWRIVLENIQSGKYREAVETCRKIKDVVSLRKAKTRLPAVTFCATFDKNRDRKNVLAPTGFIIPDLDHLEDIKSVFATLRHDENIWFMFRSPSGEGIKCGLRAEGIKTDEDIKRFFGACSRYFHETYGLKLDPACKDISRLTFVSYDPDLFINSDPSFFDITAWEKPQETPEHFYMPASTDNGWKGKYGDKVLESACRQIAESQKGEQHNTRLRMGTLVGGFIASGFIDEGNAIGALEQAVKASGAERFEAAMKTVSDGIANGKTRPLHPIERQQFDKRADDIQFYCDTDTAFGCTQQTQPTQQTQQTQQDSLNTQQTKQDSAGTQQDSAITQQTKQDLEEYAPKTGPQPPQNLAAHIRDWIKNSTGSFTVDQLDREFCLTTRKEKNLRAWCLSACIEKKLINRDKRIKGKYYILDNTLNIIDIFSVSEDPFSIKLPFNLHENVIIPKKCIIVLAGSSNAGKTALMLNILKLNLSQKYKKLYLMSEMGPGEYVDRVKRLENIDLREWGKNITASERPCDFNGAIEHHNRDGLTCIDFLEEVDGEYFRMATDIRNIYDSLGDGVAVIAIQKKTTEEYARGGQATAEKARLYMTVDLIQVEPHSIICALKIIKLKRYTGRNLQGHEIFFEIHSGSQISELSEWQPASPANRAIFKAKINNQHYVHTFMTVSGRTVGVTPADYQKWVNNFGNKEKIQDVLNRLSIASHTKSWLNDTKWFHQVSGILHKELGSRE